MINRDLDARLYARALAREVPEAAHLQAIRDTAASPIETSPDCLQQVLDTAAFLLLCPEQTVPVARAMGPLLLDVVARALSAARAGGGKRDMSAAGGGSTFAGAGASTSPAEQAEAVLVAMSRLLPCAPYALPLALQYWRSSCSPFDFLLLQGACLVSSTKGSASTAAHATDHSSSSGTSVAAAVAAPALHPAHLSSSSSSCAAGGGLEEEKQALLFRKKKIHAVCEAAHKLLACPILSPSIRELWNWSSFFDLCRHEDTLVRWRAVEVCSILLGVDERGRRALLGVAEASDLAPEEQREPSSSTFSASKSARSSVHPTSAAASADAAAVGVEERRKDAEAILNASLDLAEELRRAPSALLLYSPPAQDGGPSFEKCEDSMVDDGDGLVVEAAGLLKKSVAVGRRGASETEVTAVAVPYHHHPSVVDIGGILHAKISAPNPSSSASGHSSSSRAVTTSASVGGGGGAGSSGGKPGRVGQSSSSRFVSTASASRNLANLSLAMTVDRPILLHGPAGAGKSLLAREVARLAGEGKTSTTTSNNSQHFGGGASYPGDGTETSPALLELHLDDQTDSKSLLGSHACTDVPGEFAWQPGALTRAAMAGTWVLFEDLDRAAFEVLAAIGPLLEGRPLALPGRRKPLRAAPGFRVFGTVTTSGPARVVLGGAADFGALWTHVAVEPLSIPETLEVARKRYPDLPTPALKRLLHTMVVARGPTASGHRGGFGFASRSSAGREPGVRDFLKLCSRVQVLSVFDTVDEMDDGVDSGGGSGDGGDDLRDDGGWFCSEGQALPAVVESLDVFAGHLTTKEALTHAAEVVTGLWNVLPSKAVELAITRRPEFVIEDDYLKIGRVTLPRLNQMKGPGDSSSFAPTSHALRLMETLAASARACEPVLLVGETGCGKTALVQRLASGTGRELVVQNLSLQTDGADLLGGFRPVEIRQLAQEVLEEFLRLFPLLFSANQNARFCQAVTSSFERRQWKRLSAGLRNAAKMAREKLDRARVELRAEDSSSKPSNENNDKSQKSNKAPRSTVHGGSASPSGQRRRERRDWDRFSSSAERFERQRLAVEGSFAFSFVEGVLVKAIREGKWVLLDEINLASAETLQRLSGLLEGAEGSLCLTERGDVDQVVRHPDFRLFAAMNPPTDASKKDLPPALRRRFSEVYVPELEDRLDLKRVVDGYIAGVSLETDNLAFTAVDLYLWARGLAGESLSDGAGQRPRYSLRTLVGAVSACRRLVDRGFSPKRAMVEGFRGAFETQLDQDGRAKILKGILRAFGKDMTAKDLEKPPRRPGGRGASTSPWVRIGPFWLEGGPIDPIDAAKMDPETKQRRFVLTTSVEGTLRCLARAVASADSPVLLQGPTSAGKTSIVEYLAARLGHRCVRINNHEHTDIQEYTGTYAADGNGKLSFQEGVLVESLRKGYWIILDELNLAPSEVLEALNRLLDHNRELYLSETQETIKPHANFRLFATQNPPGAYGGRKPLSRAFRNRFMEVHVDDIPGVEWEVILAERCGLPPSHCKLLVKVLHELQAQRQRSRLFLGKHGAISPRDLLRWAGRKPHGKQELAEEGYMLLAERLRSEEEKAAMRAVLEEQIGVPVDPVLLYATSRPTSKENQQVDRTLDNATADATGDGDAMIDEDENVNEADLGGFAQLAVVEGMLDRGQGLEAGLQGVAMTRHMRRLFRLSGRCLSHLEPLLLVGATGCGKTTVCQLYSMLLGRRMHVVNCHQNTEAADLLGGLRPLRGRDRLAQELRERSGEFLRRCSVATHRLSHSHQGIAVEGDVVAGDVEGVDVTGEAVTSVVVVDKMSVDGLTTVIQATWTKLANLLRETDKTASPGDVKALPGVSASTASAQKRPRPSDTSDDQIPRQAAPSSSPPSAGDSQVTKPEQELKSGASAALVDNTSAPDDRRAKGKGRGKRRRATKAGGGSADARTGTEPPPPLPTRRSPEATVVGGAEVQPVERVDNLNAGTGCHDRTPLVSVVAVTGVGEREMGPLEEELRALLDLAARTKGLFEWVDGPLITAMRNGEMILLDELSLAEDAVLERLNSVLEPGRSITLAERGGQSDGQGAAETVVAAPGFRVMATMNPGGDFGKRELSPALRSRFTEVWVPALSEREDMQGVVQKAFQFGKVALSPGEGGLTQMAVSMLDFAWWFNNEASPSLAGGNGLSLSVRDLLSWTGFITSSLAVGGNDTDTCSSRLVGTSGCASDDSVTGKQEAGALRPWEAYVHGASLVLLDGMGLGSSLSVTSIRRLRSACAAKLAEQIPACAERDSALVQLAAQGDTTATGLVALDFRVRPSTCKDASPTTVAADPPVTGHVETAGDVSAHNETAANKAQLDAETACASEFGVDHFFTTCGPLKAKGAATGDLDFSVRAPTTSKNLFRVLRALQVRKAVLLEGSPGVGKTSLISALAAATGHELVRINLSEQTDVSDLFGSDLPVPDSDGADQSEPSEGGGGTGSGARFAWCDGIFLSALKAGKWVLLDELNLATQSVLEGLNACLDHRAEVYIPELGRSFRCPPTFKVFAAQNPLGQGGGRKGLPRSFLSRFTKVFVDPLTPEDLLYIAENKFPSLAVGAVGDEAALSKKSLLSRMITFNSMVQRDTVDAGKYGRKGSPWEFNLRDVFRWCELMIKEQSYFDGRGDGDMDVDPDGWQSRWEPWLLVDTLYIQRMRTHADREALLACFREAFPEAFSLNMSSQGDSSGRSSELASRGTIGPNVPGKFLSVGGGLAVGGIGTHPVLRVTPDWIQVGHTVLPRGCWLDTEGATGGGVGDQLENGMPMAFAFRRPLQALARCVTMRWPALVVGHRGSGKTSIIQGLAAAVGARLTEVAMTPSVDVTELLGCFEQTDAMAEQDALLEALQTLTEKTSHAILASRAIPGLPERGGRCGVVWNAWHAVRMSYRSALSPSRVQGVDGVPGFDAQGMSAVQHLLSAVRDVIQRLSAEADNVKFTNATDPSDSTSRHGSTCGSGGGGVVGGGDTTASPTSSASSSCSTLSSMADLAGNLAGKVRRGQMQTVVPPTGAGGKDQSKGSVDRKTSSSSSASCFRWSDGVLVEALERGDWVVLDGANLCSASVLDRLNPLLEPGGVLPLTECGTSSDDNSRRKEPGESASSHRIVRPHPNFRLFLTADPACGEVSRAMRNRCVEISLLEASPATAVGPVRGSPDGNGSLAALTENSMDLLSVVRASGITDPREATAALAVHSALVSRRCRGKGSASSGEGPAPRSLKLWADLAASARSRCSVPDSLRGTLSLAYPAFRAGGAGGALAEGKVAEAALSACLGALDGDELQRGLSGLLEVLATCAWDEVVRRGVSSQVDQDTKVLRILGAAASSGLGDASRQLLSLVLGAVVDNTPVRVNGYAMSPAVGYSDLDLTPGDEQFIASVCSLSEVNGDLTTKLQLQAAALFARKACVGDRHLRLMLATRLSALGGGSELGLSSANVGDTVGAMMVSLFDCSGWKDVSTLLAEISSDMPGGASSKDRGESAEGLARSVSSAKSMWSPHDPRSNPDLFRSLQRASQTSPKWQACMLLLELLDSSLSRRLPVILLERSNIEKAQARIRSGRGSVAGFGWLALSCLVCDGGLDALRMGARGGGCAETRLARSALVPYLLPLLRAVDGVVGGLVCREAAEIIAEGGAAVPASNILFAVQEVLAARDSLAELLTCPSASVAGPDASAGGEGGVGEMLFRWDLFLVAWQWLHGAVDALSVGVSPLRGLMSSSDMSGSWAGLTAVAARVDAAVLEHAGGAAPGRDTLWERGPRAAAPCSAKGALAIARLHRLAKEFRIVPQIEVGGIGYANEGEGKGEAGATLGKLMRGAHPALCVPLDVRRELLDALCTLHWAASCELGDRSAAAETPASTAGLSARKADAGGDVGDGGDDGGDSLAEQLPPALESSLKLAKAKFHAKHKGTRLGSAQREEGIGRDDLEFGERFDDFDTEAAEAVASATLLVVSGDASVGGDGAGGGCSDGVEGGGVLMNWALVQLSLLREHWIAVEESAVLALLSSYEIFSRNMAVVATVPSNPLVASAEPGAGDQRASSWSHRDQMALMSRVARLRSAVLSTPSLSPAVARPYQTLLWAWGNPTSWPTVSGPLLSRLLPLALDSFSRRLWENVVGTPGGVSLQLAPPQMVPQAGSEGMGGTAKVLRSAEGLAVLNGPAQLLTLSRSAFFLRLVSTATFPGGIVPGVSAQPGNPAAVDLTLMNVSARLVQYRVAMRAVQTLRDITPGALKSLADVSLAGLCRTLDAFDGLVSDEGDKVGDGDTTLFRDALRSVAEETGEVGSPGTSLEKTQAALTRAIEACPDERLADQGAALVLPAATCLVTAVGALGEDGEGPTTRTKAAAGLGMALLGCLKLALLLPSSPVDPGLKPALQKSLLEGRLDGVKGELTVRRWSLRLEGSGDVSPEMISMLKQARELRDDCQRLGLEAIERPPDRPDFHALFRDCHAFARGVGNPDRVTILASSLSSLAGFKLPTAQTEARLPGGASNARDVRAGQALDHSRLLQEETVWQGAAGAFVSRCRDEYGEAYVDVVTGICDAVEVTRVGLRLLAASCAEAVDVSRNAAVGEGGIVTVPTLARLQGLLLCFPYPCSEGLTAMDGDGDASDDLCDALQVALSPDALGCLGSSKGKDGPIAATGAQHMTVLQAVLSRAELLLSSGSSGKAALDVVVTAMGAAVDAWSRIEAEEAEKRRKEAEIIKYKMQEHVVESEEAINLAQLRSLFPDYHSTYKDLIVDPSHQDQEDPVDDNAQPADDVDARVRALGHLSEKDLSSVVARHARIFLSISRRKRVNARALARRCSASSVTANSSFSKADICSSDSERLVAFGDSYRAAVLLATPTASLPASLAMPKQRGGPAGGSSGLAKVLHLEQAFAGSHLLAGADAARLCKSGRNLLEDLSVAETATTAGDPKKKSSKTGKRKGEVLCKGGGVSGIGWLADGEAGSNLPLVDPFKNFHLDSDIVETRLADAPLAAVLRRVAGLLEEFPGHGVLIQLARIADRVRRMPLHSPLAAVLAGVELTLRKAQDWEQHAHRGVSLKEELRTLSSLVVRWRAVELQSWPQLLDARERSFAAKANRWWLHLYRLLTGDWGEDLRASNPLKNQAPSSTEAPTSDTTRVSALGESLLRKEFPSPDWRSARRLFPNWLWLGLVSEEAANTKTNSSGNGLGIGDFDHARGLFQPLDDFLRTSSVGEFFSRLQMVRAFAAHLRAVSDSEHFSVSNADGAVEGRDGEAHALTNVLEGLWQYYAQFSEEVLLARDLVRNSIEKKLKEEAKLAKWDEQTYYSLAEASEKSHRKLSKLVTQYDEVLDVSVSEILHRALVAGIGERKEGNDTSPQAPCTEIPSLSAIFSLVKKVDSASDFVDDDDQAVAESDDTADREDHEEDLGKSKMPPPSTKPPKQQRLKAKSVSSPENSLQILDACLPVQPGLPVAAGVAPGGAVSKSVTIHSVRLSPWLRNALFGGVPDGNASSAASTATTALTARITPLTNRMRSLLLKRVYAKRRSGSAGSGGWADEGRPAGFLGSGLGEELALAVFGRIQALKAKNVGKQVKKRAVLDLLGGMRKQGLRYAKSSTPPQASDMLHVMALAKPFSADRLAGFDDACVLAGGDGGKSAASHVADVMRKADKYCLRGLSELSRLRLEAGAPVSRDMTRREAEVMRGLAEHLGLLVLQQRGATAVLESELWSLIQEVDIVQSFTKNVGSATTSASGDDAGDLGRDGGESSAGFKLGLPPQTPLRSALETQRVGLLRGVEAIREIKLLVKAVIGSDSPTAASKSGGELADMWGLAATDAVTSTELVIAVKELEMSVVEMHDRLEGYPSFARSGFSRDGSGDVEASPLLTAGALADVVETQEKLRALSVDATECSERFADVVPPSVLIRVATHLDGVYSAVKSVLSGNSVMRGWMSAQATHVALGQGSGGMEGDPSDVVGPSPEQEFKVAVHVSKIGNHLLESVKAMLLSVQALCPRNSENALSTSDREAEEGLPTSTGERAPGGDGPATEDGPEEDEWSTGSTLFEAHASAFDQAKGLKLWRCSAALAAATLALKEFSEDEAVNGAGGPSEATLEAGEALGRLSGEVMQLAEQVVSAAKAVLIGMIALNKGTAKLLYVTVRVFRTLLSKGLCSDETEDAEGDGDGDIDGMKFDDDVEGTGMGEGEGKKDVTDQIEDEEQLLGLKGDEPDKDQAEESKELGEDEQDNGMEMENDFEGEMFDVPKGEKDQDAEDDAEEKEELDREMGDLGDDADVVDMKLWDEDEEDEDADGKEQGEEKFESGSRLDGEKPEEDEIRTKEDGQEDKDVKEGEGTDGKEEDPSKAEDKEKADKDGGDNQTAQEEEADGDGDGGDDGEEGEGEGPVNDDLEDNYEEKPVGVEVRAEDEAMEVDEEGREGEGPDGGEEDGKDKDGEEDLPDDLNLDNADDDGGEEGDDKDGVESDGKEEGDEGDNADEPKEKEGFESLAPEENGEEEGQELLEDEQQPQGSGNAGAPELDPMEEEKDKDEPDEEAKDEEEDADGVDEEKRKADGAEEPPAFGVEGDGGDSSVLEAAKQEGAEKPVQDETGEEEQEKEEGEDGGGSAPDGRDDGGGGGQGDEGDGGEWRPDMSGGEGRGEGQGNDKKRTPEAPNPFRVPGDAMRHWRRRLDMLKDKDDADQDDNEAKEGDDKDDPQDEEGGEGKFEYVTGDQKGSSQVLGGVSDEQAAEAAAHQTEAAEEEEAAVEDGNDSDDGDDLKTMEDGDEEAAKATNDAEDEHLQAVDVDTADSNRKSGKKRNQDGHQAGDEEKANVQDEGQEETDSSVPDKKVVDFDSLHDQPSGDPDSYAQIITNPQSGDPQEHDADQDHRQTPLVGAANLREELHTIAEELQRKRLDRDGEEQEGLEESRELWGRLRGVTSSLSQRLCEQLRLVLEPMVATKLQGDYRSGKRINMRRVIPYIASGFRKDKIWLRRTKPAKRDYQILMAIDDSESMVDCGAGALALAAMTTVASGLTQLEAGQLAVARFGEDLELLHGFGEAFTEEAGAKIIDGFTFDQSRTNTARTLEGVVSLLEEARNGLSSSSGGVGTKGTPRQLVLLLSDGRFDRENKDRLRKLVREMNERGQLLVLIVLDKEGDTSILKTKEASYVNGKLVLNGYLDKYPFPLYILLSHVEALPEILADALRQWFELLQRQTST